MNDNNFGTTAPIGTNDTYPINSSGTDTVTSSVNYILGANVKNLKLVDGLTITGFGNELNNTLIGGNNADNILIGADGDDTLDGGRGNKNAAGQLGGGDDLYGGAGNDTYLYTFKYADNLSSLTTADGLDTIYEESGQDTLVFNTNVDSSVALSKISVNRLSNNLSFSISTSNKVLVQNFFSVASAKIEKVIFNNSTGGFSTTYDVKDIAITYSGSGSADILNGWDGIDVINGNAGNDLISGYNGDDILDGNDGADTIYGGDGNDTIQGGYGNDIISGGKGNDILKDKGTDITGGETYIFNQDDGSDIISDSGGAKDILLFNGINLDELFFAKYNQDLVIARLNSDDNITVKDWYITQDSAGLTNHKIETLIIGNTALSSIQIENLASAVVIDSLGNKTITGTAGNDILNGGFGENKLIGGAGNDTYIIDSSNDKIVEFSGGGIDTVISSVDISTLFAFTERLTLSGNATRGGGNSDNNIIQGNALNNILDGRAGNDTLDGDLGADSLIGGLGNDTYLFNINGGKDVIAESAGADSLIFGAGINANQLWFQHTGNNLVVSRIGTADSVTIKDWYLQPATNNTHVETFKSGDGKALLDSQVENLVQAMASFAAPAAGVTSLPSNYQTVLNTVIAASWK